MSERRARAWVQGEDWGRRAGAAGAHVQAHTNVPYSAMVCCVFWAIDSEKALVMAPCSSRKQAKRRSEQLVQFRRDGFAGAGGRLPRRCTCQTDTPGGKAAATRAQALRHAGQKTLAERMEGEGWAILS